MEISSVHPHQWRRRRGGIARPPPAIPGGDSAAVAAFSKRSVRIRFLCFSRSVEEGEEHVDLFFSRSSGRNRLLSTSRSPADERRLTSGTSASAASLRNGRIRITSVGEGERNPLLQESNKVLSKILRKEAAIGGVERKAVTGTSTRRLWPKAVLDALDDAVCNDRWESALQIFSLLRKQKWYNPMNRTYARMMMMLGRCGQSDHASSLFKLMLSDGLKPTPDVVTALVNAYALNSLWDEAFSLIEDMKSLPDCKPDTYTYTILINSICKLQRFDLIPRAVSDMGRLGIRPNVITHNIIIDGFGKAKMLREMELSLSRMIESQDCLPDQCTMNSILWAYGDCGWIDQMERIYDEFHHMGIEPDTMTFNIMIRSYGRARMHEKMLMVVDFMKKRFFSPTIITFNSMIDCFAKTGNIEKMEEIFREMKFKGVKPNSITYCSIVSGYGKVGLSEKIPLILRQIENSDARLDAAFFNCVINAYGEAGEVKIMEEMFLLMREKQIEPDRVTQSTMVRAYKRAGISKIGQNLEIGLLEE